jgi:hypothetical protein
MGVQFVRPYHPNNLALQPGSTRPKGTIPMKKIMLTLLFFTATAFAQSPFDGTWVSDLGAAQFSKKPHTYVLNKGMYTCSTCVPKISVKADGQDQAVSGSNYFNTVAIHEVDANTMEEVDKKDGKTMYKDTFAVSADGKTLTDKFEDDSEDKPVTGEMIFSRIDKGPAGSHAMSGSWRTEKMANVSSNGITVTLQSTPNGMKMSDNNGQSYDVKFDGKDYPIQGDPGNTMISLKKVDANTMEETDKRNGKVVYTARITVSADGKTITYVGHDRERDRTSTFVLNKKS